MTGWRFVIRSLVYHWRMNATVALGVAAATAVLTGALLVGDSVRGSLRRLTLDRLGCIDEILISERFFRADLAAEVSASPGFRKHFATTIPAILFPRATLEKRAEAVVARASQVTVIGSQPDFWAAGKITVRPRVLPEDGEIVLNAPLAAELDAKVGDQVVLRLPKSNLVPADSPLGRRTDRIRSLPGLKVVDIVPAEGLGCFSWQASQTTPRNAYVATRTLESAIQQPGQVNSLLVIGSATDSPPSQAAEDALANALRPSLEDYGLVVRRIRHTFQPAGAGQEETVYDYFDVSTDRLLFAPAAGQAAEQALADEQVQPVLTNLATSLAKAGAEAASGIPYSLVTAVDSCPPLGPLATEPGDSGERLADDEIVLNSWAASDLRATPGDRIRMTFYEPETTHGKPREQTAEFTLKAIVPLTEPTSPVRRNRPARYKQRPGLANDPDLTPVVEGLTDQDSISKWEAPFPVDYRRVRPQDDVYWQNHRTTPKAFLTLAAGRKLWASRFGQSTSFRIPAPTGLRPGSQAEQRFERRLEDRLLEQLDARRAQLGFAFLPVKARGLAASAGTTPFGVLFLFLSFFVIAAAILLVALLFRLGVERRAEEIGILLALGLQRKQIGRWLMGEGGLVATAGGVFGVATGVGYAWLMLAGLRTCWSGAVQTPSLGLYVTPASLGIGYLSGVLVSVATIAWSLRGTQAISVCRLLAGEASAEARPKDSSLAPVLRGEGGGEGRTSKCRSYSSADPKHARMAPPGRWRTFIPVGLLLTAIGLVIGATRWGGEAQAGAFVGSGTLVLAALLITVRNRLRLRGVVGLRPAQMRLATLALQNAGRNPGRSTATIGLMAMASFLIVAMSAFRLEPSAVGTGGFDLIAESSEPIFGNLNRPEVRQDLLADDAGKLADTAIIGFRVQPGDDASCNNLYRATQPRVLGVTEELIRHFDAAGGPSFAWASSAAKTAAEQTNPWRLLSPELPAKSEGETPGSAGVVPSRGPVPGPARNSTAGRTDAEPAAAVPVVLDQNTAMYSLQLYQGIGEEFAVTYDDGQTIRFRVVGLLANSILQGSLLISEQDFVQRYPAVSGYRLFLIQSQRNPPPPKNNALASVVRGEDWVEGPTSKRRSYFSAVPTSPPVATLLEARLSDQGFDAVSADARLADLLAVQNTYLSTFQSLGALGLLLGTFGLAAVQARNVLERRRELALLRAVGFRLASLARLVMFENIGLLVAGLATGCGAALIVVLPHLLLGGAAVPWRDLAIMLGSVLLVGLLVSLATVRTTLRAPLLPALRGD
ncbi:MAG: ABC transporter permease [Planctomycetota bacterium]|nr:ABC transporter permease [Planctomycetota bacterium]